MSEEKEGVMRNAMTTRAPGGAKNGMILPLPLGDSFMFLGRLCAIFSFSVL